MLKTFICTGDLNQGESFRITDSEEIDAMVNDPFEFFSGIISLGYKLVQVIPTLYTYAEGKLSLRESVWILEMAHLA